MLLWLAWFRARIRRTASSTACCVVCPERIRASSSSPIAPYMPELIRISWSSAFREMGSCCQSGIFSPSAPAKAGRRVTGVFSAFLFGVVYSVSLTPCVGAFLGSALMLAAGSGTAGKGLLLLVVYSMGLGVPFLLSAVLLQRLEGAFRAIKSHYTVINRICGIFLILVGVCMAAGWLNRLMAAFS